MPSHLPIKNTKPKRNLILLLISSLFLFLLYYSIAGDKESSDNYLVSVHIEENADIKNLVLDNELYVPSITITKVGDPILTGDRPCELVEYTYTVTNTSTAGEDLINVVLTDPQLGVVINGGPNSGDVGNDNITGPGEVWEYLRAYNTTLQDRANDQVVSASAEVEADVQGQFITVNDQTAEVNLPLGGCRPRIAMRKSSTPPNSGCTGLSYIFRLQNVSLGDDDLENIEIIDPLFGPNPIVAIPTGDDGDGLLEPLETWTYTVPYNITQSDIQAGQIINQAQVTANIANVANEEVNDLSDDDSYLEDDPTITDLSSCQDPDIGLIKTAELFDIDGDNCDDHIEYTFTITNTGNIDLEEITLEDPLLGGELPGPFSGDMDNDGKLSASVNEVWEYVVLYDITQQDIDNGNVDNQAEVKATLVNNSNTQINDLSDDDSYFEDNSTTIDLDQDVCDDHQLPIGLIKTTSPQLIDIDNDGCADHIHYVFTVKNLGNIDLEEVTLEDNLLGGEVSGPDSGDQGFDNILSPNEEWVYNALYDITQQDIDLGQIQNQAEVKAVRPNNNQVQDLSDDDSFLEDQPTITSVNGSCDNHDSPLGLIKQGELLDQNNDGCANTIQYTFTLRNTGTLDFGTVTIADSFFDDISGPGTSDAGNDGILSVNEEWIYTASYSLNQADLDLGSIENQAFVTAELVDFSIQFNDLSDDDSFDENEPTITSIADGCIPVSSIGLIKEGELIDQNNNGCDDYIRYNFTIANIGTVHLDNIRLVDDTSLIDLTGPDESYLNTDGVLSVGEEWTYTALYIITHEDIDLGEVENQTMVMAETINSSVEVSDLSDHTNFAEDRTTLISVAVACADGSADFEIFNGITPNGDGVNDYFRINGIENYPNNTVKIFNRWGVEVYKVDGYGQGINLFYGISQARATISEERELPSGTYFYILEFQEDNPGQSNYSGYIYINRD